MKFILFTTFCLFSLQNVVFSSHMRSVRSMTGMSDMIRCIFGKSVLAYLGYGCYCGLGGAGEPVDEIDTCCKYHDQCYRSLLNGKVCSKFALYFKTHKNECVENEVQCIFAEGAEPTKCEEHLCHCDLTWANCVAKHPHPSEKKACPKDE